MAKLNIPHPQALLGRYVVGAYSCGGLEFTFQGEVECIVLTAPNNREHSEEIYVSGEYIRLEDCHRLDYA
jgi:hypothetical protein